MCEPISLGTLGTITATQLAVASAATSALGSIATFAVQSQNADRQASAAQSAYDSSVVQIKNQQVEQSQAASAQMSERARQALVETSHLQALSNESGTNGGGSNDRVTNEANFNAGTDIATMENSASSQQRSLAGQAQGAYSTASQRMSSIQQPSLIGTGLQIAGAGLSSATGLQRANAMASGKIPVYQGAT
jgi:hypothetical protein